jgi:hypothetical protein
MFLAPGQSDVDPYDMDLVEAGETGEQDPQARGDEELVEVSDDEPKAQDP